MVLHLVVASRDGDVEGDDVGDSRRGGVRVRCMRCQSRFKLIVEQSMN